MPQGRELAAGLYADVIAPAVPDVPHAAALLGWGSDVLGLDDDRSTDHGWGPRLQVFVDAERVADVASRIEGLLPESYRGHPVRFGWDDVPVTHHVHVCELGPWVEGVIGFDPLRGATTREWLLAPQQRLLSVTAGAVFADDGRLGALRDAAAWYPHDVWLWLLACQWRRIEQEESFVGRAAEVGDDLGSRLVAARLVRDVMRLCFLQERRYAPYAKWLGTVFGQLDAAVELGPLLEGALAAATWPEREQALVRALEAVAVRQNALAVTDEVDPAARAYHSRPFRVIGAGRFVDACLAHVGDSALRGLAPVGSIDQFADSSDVLAYPLRARRLDGLYTVTPTQTGRPPDGPSTFPTRSV